MQVIAISANCDFLCWHFHVLSHPILWLPLRFINLELPFSRRRVKPRFDLLFAYHDPGLTSTESWRVVTSRDESWRVVTSRVTLRWSVTGVTGVTESMLRRVTTCYDAALESSSRVFLAAVSPGAGGRWPPRDRRNPGALGSTTLQPLQDVGNCWNMEKIGTYFQHIFNILELVGTNWREVTKVTRAQDMNSTRFFRFFPCHTMALDGATRSQWLSRLSRLSSPACEIWNISTEVVFAEIFHDFSDAKQINVSRKVHKSSSMSDLF